MANPSIQAFGYSTKAPLGRMEANRNSLETIEEVFIPSHQIIFNSSGAVFHAITPRNVYRLSPIVLEESLTVTNPLTEIQLTHDFVQKIVQISLSELELTNNKNDLAFEFKTLLG